MDKNTPTTTDNREKNRAVSNGWLMLLINLVLLFGAIALFLQQITGERSPLLIAGAIGLEILAIILLCGHFTLQPNESRVLLLFGDYHGTVRKSGFFWANPFYSHSRGRIPVSGAERECRPQQTPGDAASLPDAERQNLPAGAQF